MKLFRWALSAVALALASAPVLAEAQTLTVEGSAQYHGQPQGAPHAPPGYGYGYGQPTYGQPSGPTYGQPTYGQPAYAPALAPRARQVRYEDRETSVKGLWIPGIVIFGVSYGLTATLGQALSWDPDYGTAALIPLVGPWMMLAYADNDDEAAGALLAGIGQLAGATMFVLGLVLRETVRVAVYSLDERNERAPQLALDVLPAPAGAMVGLTLSHF